MHNSDYSVEFVGETYFLIIMHEVAITVGFLVEASSIQNVSYVIVYLILASASEDTSGY